MKRVLTAVVLIAIVFALIFFGKLWMLTLFAAIVAELAAFEYLQLANLQRAGESSSAHIPLWWMVLGTALLFLVNLPGWPTEAMLLPMLSALTLILLAWNGFRESVTDVLPDTAKGLLGLIYVAYPLTLIPAIWKQEDGVALLLFLLLCVWAGDIAALYVGRAFGKRKLAPRLSPGKTWAGAIASVAGSVIAGMALVYVSSVMTDRGNLTLHIGEPWWQSLLLAILLNVAAQTGDLLESAIKRGANVKDSGTMLPGHGGVLDRIDALLLAAPVLWYVLLIKDYFGLGRF